MTNMLDEQVSVSEIKGTLVDLLEKLAGKDSKNWLIAFKKFLRRENPWPEYTFKSWKKLVMPAGSSEHSVARDFWNKTPLCGHGVPTLNFEDPLKSEFEGLSENELGTDLTLELFEISVEELGFECEPEDYDTQKGVGLSDVVKAILDKDFMLLNRMHVQQLMIKFGEDLDNVLVPVSVDKCMFISEHKNIGIGSHGHEVPTLSYFPCGKFPMTAKFVVMKK